MINDMVYDFFTKVGYAPANFVRYANVDDAHQIALFLEDVPFTPLPMAKNKCVAMEVEESLEGGVKIFSTKFTVPLSKKVTLPDDPLVFLLTSLNEDMQYLVGLDGRPYPVHARHDTFPDGFSSGPHYGLEVTWRSLYPPLEVIYF